MPGRSIPLRKCNVTVTNTSEFVCDTCREGDEGALLLISLDASRASGTLHLEKTSAVSIHASSTRMPGNWERASHLPVFCLYLAVGTALRIQYRPRPTQIA